MRPPHWFPVESAHEYKQSCNPNRLLWRCNDGPDSAICVQDPDIHARYLNLRATREFPQWPIFLLDMRCIGLGKRVTVGSVGERERLLVTPELETNSFATRDSLNISDTSFDGLTAPVVEVALHPNCSQDYHNHFSQSSGLKCGNELWTPWDRLPSGSNLVEESEVALQVSAKEHITYHSELALY